MSATGIYGLSGSGIDVDSMVKVGMLTKQNEYDRMYKKEVRQEWTKEAYANLYSDLTTFTTTLASSRWKSLDQINQAGTWAASQVEGTTFWERNWRKGGLQERRNQLLRENNFYNQLYCGCEFSLRDTSASR